MKKIKNLIAQIMLKQNLKWVLLFLIIGGLFIGDTYAQSNVKQTTLDFTTKYLHLIISLFSWVWIILANLAGKLMTNDLIYGSFLHLDASLWTLWNIMKNFANFALGFLVVYAVVRNIFDIMGSAGDKWKPLNIIKKTLIAGVMIQMSWFLMGAVIDLSTIMTAAVGSFPSQFIASNNEMKGAVNSSLKSLQKGYVVFDPSNEKEIVKWEENKDFKEIDEDGINKLFDMIMPSYDSVSGPLLFIGLSVFHFNDFESYAASSGGQNNTVTKRGDLFLSLGMSLIILLFFSIMMLLLFLFNLFRLIVLWIVIPLMPIIILANVFEFKPEGDMGKLLDYKHILSLIFKPVLMVGALSLVLIILIFINQIIAGNKVDKITFEGQNMSIESVAGVSEGLYTSTLKSNDIMSFTMSDTKDTIANMIVYFFGLFLIFFLVKLTFNSGTGISFVDDKITKTFDMMNNLATSVPIVPIGGGASIKAIKNANVPGAINNVMGMPSTDDQDKMIDERLHIDNKSFADLHTGMKREEFISSAKNISSSMGITSNADMFANSDFRKELNAWNIKHNNTSITESNIDSNGTKTKQKNKNDK